jgi:hypothetical protein
MDRIDPSMQEQGPGNPEIIIPTDDVFPDFEWNEGERPDDLRVNESGFFEDSQGRWYMVRNAKNAVDLNKVALADLYNGRKAGGWNASEGSGLYFANYPEAAERVPFVGGKVRLRGNLYVSSVDPSENEILDATASVKGRIRGHQIVGLLLRAKAVFPAVPPIPARKYDRWYGNVDVVTMRPIALTRLVSGRGLRVGEGRLKPRWALLRNPQRIKIVGRKTAA